MMRYLGKVVLLAVAYFVAGNIGQSLAIPPGNVTLVWPPSGIALAALLLGGDRLWPAIWLGALLVNVRTLFDPALSPSLAASLTAAAAIATGSTVQALVGRRWIAHLAGGPSFLDRARGVFRFTAGAMMMCLIGSTAGATSLAMAGFIPRDAHGFVWRTWWLGDLAGVLAFTPLLVAWTRRPPARWAPGRLAEAAALVEGRQRHGGLVEAGIDRQCVAGRSAAVGDAGRIDEPHRAGRLRLAVQSDQKHGGLVVCTADSRT